MSTEFEDCIAKITSTSSILHDLDERAVELGVVLPLLRCAGWDTEDLTQIYPQKPVSESKRDKVDYDLQVGGVSRVFLEVKRWKYDLGKAEEDQLRDYCMEGKPKLAVLTNGRQWRFYLPPFTKRKEPETRVFRSFDITRDSEEVVEENFRQFLAYDSVRSLGSTLKLARQLHRERIRDATVRQNLRNALGDIADDKQKQREALEVLAEHFGISASETQLEQFINSNGNPINLGNDSILSGKKPLSKPISFTLRAAGEAVTQPVKSWKDLKRRVCILMHERNPDNFRRVVLGMPRGWFSESSSIHAEPIGDTGIYAKGGNAHVIEKLCRGIVAEFYPDGSLTIETRGGKGSAVS